jgi:hypothetical protein
MSGKRHTIQIRTRIADLQPLETGQTRLNLEILDREDQPLPGALQVRITESRYPHSFHKGAELTFSLDDPPGAS